MEKHIFKERLPDLNRSSTLATETTNVYFNEFVLSSQFEKYIQEWLWRSQRIPQKQANTDYFVSFYTFCKYV